MSDELLDALADAFISLKIADVRKGITFYQWAEQVKCNRQVMEYINLRGVLCNEGNCKN